MNPQKPVKADEPESYNLFLAGNPVYEVSMLFQQLANQQAKIFEQMLANILHADVRVTEKVTVEQDYLDAHSDARYFRSWVITKEDMPKFSVLSIEKKMAFCMLDLICGGTGKAVSKMPHGDLNLGEKKVIRRLAQTLFDSIYESLKETMPLKLSLTSEGEHMTAENKYKGARHHMISTTFTIRTDVFSGALKLSSPTNNMRSYPIDDSSNHPQLKAKLSNTMLGVSLPMSATLGTQQSTLRKIKSLRPGDIIPLDKPLHADVFVGEKKMCQAKVFTTDSKLYLQVQNGQAEADNSTDELEPEESRNRGRSRRRTEARSTEARSTEARSTETRSAEASKRNTSGRKRVK